MYRICFTYRFVFLFVVRLRGVATDIFFSLDSSHEYCNVLQSLSSVRSSVIDCKQHSQKQIYT